jgi:hypothetical protein
METIEGEQKMREPLPGFNEQQKSMKELNVTGPFSIGCN